MFLNQYEPIGCSRLPSIDFDQNSWKLKKIGEQDIHLNCRYYQMIDASYGSYEEKTQLKLITFVEENRILDTFFRHFLIFNYLSNEEAEEESLRRKDRLLVAAAVKDGAPF